MTNLERAQMVEDITLRVTRMERPSPAADLFVMVKNLPYVWRLKSYDDDFLHLDSLDRLHSMKVLKTLCRVGEAKHWRGSRFAEAWEAGGGAP
jgi:hypothetical protein